MRNLFIIVFFSTGTVEGIAQERFKGYYEPFIELEYDVSENYSHEFAVEERTGWFENESFNVEVKQIDLSHFSTMAFDDNHELAVGVQYRFKENFVRGEENELRFIEEYTFSIQSNAIEFEHRLSAEQRIASSSTSHRFRCNFAFTRALRGPKVDTGEAYITGDLETLITVTNTEKPEYEQRIGAGIGLVLSEYIKLELVTEYRLADFTQDLGHELFLVTGMKFTL
jgi:hypothetical protein